MKKTVLVLIVAALIIVVAYFWKTIDMPTDISGVMEKTEDMVSDEKMENMMKENKTIDSMKEGSEAEESSEAAADEIKEIPTPPALDADAMAEKIEAGLSAEGQTSDDETTPSTTIKATIQAQ